MHTMYTCRYAVHIYYKFLNYQKKKAKTKYSYEKATNLQIKSFQIVIAEVYNRQWSFLL